MIHHAADEQAEIQNQSENSSFLTAEMKQQLTGIFAKLERPLVIQCEDDGSSLAMEMKAFLEEFTPLHTLLSYSVVPTNTYPSMRFLDEEGNYRNVVYHAIPGGHEFNSFVIAIYNAAGPKQAIDEAVLQKIHCLTKKQNIKVVVSLSCTMCPEVVMATQRIALENPNIEAEVFDFAHFPDIKETYQIMSVPAMIINNQDVYFGKKDIAQITDILAA